MAVRIVGRSVPRTEGLDMKTLAMALLGTPFRDATKRNMPRRWFEPMEHTHVALDDALEQGALFCNMLKELQARSVESSGDSARPTPGVCEADLEASRLWQGTGNGS